jgi:hypothetical protein
MTWLIIVAVALVAALCGFAGATIYYASVLFRDREGTAAIAESLGSTDP